MTDPIVSLIAPRRVAVFGGSNDPRKLGNFLLENLKRYGYEGDILPIHPREKQVAGLTAYQSLENLPEDPDVALICLPAGSVTPVVRSCADAGIRSAIVLAAAITASAMGYITYWRASSELITSAGEDLYSLMDLLDQRFHHRTGHG